MHIYQFIKSLIVTVILFSCYNISYASVSIDSVKTTISRCPNNGTITVFATTTQPPVLYSILSGPETRPLQSDSLFQGLFPGTYVVAATNITGERDTQTVIIKGSGYVVPDFIPVGNLPTCYGGSDGQIIGHPISSTGRKPYNWVLTNTITSVVTTQNSDTFNNLKSSTYTLRMYDSCQNFVTRTIIIENTDTVFSGVDNARVSKIGCDTIRLNFVFFSSNLHYTSPLKLVMYHLNDTITKFVYPKLDQSNYYRTGVNEYSITDTFPNVTYNSNFSYVLFDDCGRKISFTKKIPEFLFTVRLWYSEHTCTGDLGAILDIYRNVYGGFGYYYLDPKYPLTMTVKDVDSNKIVQTSQIFSGLLNITPKVSGRNYLITITDKCGTVYSFDTIFPSVGKPFVRSLVYDGCIDSTAASELRFYGFGPGLKLEILSGPRYLHSTTPKYSYSDSIIYPKTYTHFSADGIYTGGISVIDYFYIDLKNLPEGIYKFKVTDSCGNIVFDSVTVLESNLTLLHHTSWYKRGCLGENILYYKTNCYDAYFLSASIYNDSGRRIYDYHDYLNLFDSITSIPSGKYTLQIEYPQNGEPINENIKNCWIAYDTVEIPLYRPPQVASFSIIYCNGNRYAELHPDSTKGLPPYQYEVISGPKLYPLQTSNVFDFIPIGDYVTRIVDACGNSNILNFGVDTLIFPPVNIIGSSCIGGNVILFYQSSPFFTYYWTRPDGTVFIGDTMRINGVVSADTGLYHIIRFVNINNCKDSFSTTYRLVSNAAYTLNNTICEGESATLNNHVYTNSGTYTDTILSSSCDTFYTLNLTVLKKGIRNIDTTICIGHRIHIGNHFYDQPGIYSDTLISSNGCDSIINLKLSIVQSIDLSITASETIVAPGDTIQLDVISSQPLYYNWISSAILSNSHIRNPFAVINQPSWIYLNSEGDLLLRGCRRSDSIFIDIFNNCDAENVFIPNSFTPNYDGVNDIFKVRSKILQSGNLVVYDRWGNKVFESDDLTKGWDGIYKGEPAQEDAYGYSFEGTCINGEQIKLKGNVTVLR
ncbi:MAG: hypothetical protein JWN78_3207 [Bacteroidota bacterium]|nr:hypothetical protein [Bacteroidota bacterium]